MPFNSLRTTFMTIPKLDPVQGDILPPLGSRVMIHFSSIKKWVPVTVVGYFAYDDPLRVFVRTQDDAGVLNARGIQSIRPCEGTLL